MLLVVTLYIIKVRGKNKVTKENKGPMAMTSSKWRNVPISMNNSGIIDLEE